MGEQQRVEDPTGEDRAGEDLPEPRETGDAAAAAAPAPTGSPLASADAGDQEISCADCGEVFLFSAAEAEFYAARRLAIPRRCKACRAARKRSHSAAGRHRSFGVPSAPGESRSTPRHTGDVNEYRSPMPDPAFPRLVGRPPAHRGADGGNPSGVEDVAADSRTRRAGTRRRARTRSFEITCRACGAPAQVPFRPREGREVFCPTCYRARKAAQGDG